MTKKLLGKVAIVTGASKGIGASIAEHLAAEGASVIVNYASSKEGADRVVHKIIQMGGKAIAVKADMTSEQDIQKLFEQTAREFGSLDILVNNAGVYEFFPIEDLTAEKYHKMFDINVLGLLLASKEALKYFKSSGCIINISSVASTSPAPQSSIYSATKAAVDIITKSLAKELGPRNIRVNAINPGLVVTEGTLTTRLIDGGDFRERVESQTPLRRISQPHDVAPAVVFLASDEASWISGETLVISGGYR